MSPLSPGEVTPLSSSRERGLGRPLHGGARQEGTRVSPEPLMLWGGRGDRNWISCPHPHPSIPSEGEGERRGRTLRPHHPPASSCQAEPCPWQAFRDSSGLKPRRPFPSGGI